MNSGLYKITHKETGRVYIGQSKNLRSRWYAHKSRTPQKHSVIKKALLKYGVDSFSFDVLVYAKDRDYLNTLEEAAIKVYDCLTPNGFNLRKGGDVASFSDESRKRMSESRKKFMEKDGNADKYREAVCKVRPDSEAYARQAKVISSLVWMNDGVRSYRVKPELVESRKASGLVEGRLLNYVNDEFRSKRKEIAMNQWQQVKQTGHTGNLIKVAA